MGEVYRARDARLERTVAIKVRPRRRCVGDGNDPADGILLALPTLLDKLRQVVGPIAARHTTGID